MPYDYFLRIDSIAGESTDAKHQGEIAVQTFLWGETRSDSSLGTGARVGRVTAGPLIVTARASKASPPLLLACATGRRFDRAVLSARRAGGGHGQFEFLTIALTDVLITSYEVNATADGGPMDELSLAFGAIAVDYRAQNPDGSAGEVTHAEWDPRANR
jgi:type VI secretion system secreted protein Hcp